MTAADSLVSDIGVLRDLSADEADSASLADMTSAAQQELTRLETIATGGPHGHLGCVVRISAGAGGTEARDWAGMLLHMISRWCARTPGLSSQTLPGSSNKPGAASAELLIEGDGVYGRLRSEHGTHRLSRISPHGRTAKRHTSFAAISVMPVTEPDDLPVLGKVRIDTYRGSRRGGQHRNKTDSAVRATCLETGLSASCETGRSQHRNKETALAALAARVADLRRSQVESSAAAAGEPAQPADFGTRIRSYTLSPYTMVKDHRSGWKTADAAAMLDGDLDDAMAAWRSWRIETWPSAGAGAKSTPPIMP